MYGLKEKHINTIQSIFEKFPEIDEAILYGSRAKGNYRNGSDIDLTLKGEKLNLSLLSQIQIELEDTYLPHQVDLSIYHAIENPKLIEHIDRVGISFYKNKTMNEWEEGKNLHEIIQLIGGGTPKTSIPSYWDGDIPWLSVVDFNTGNKYVYNTSKCISKEGLENSSTKLLEKGDIIISARGTVGVIAMLGKQMAFNQSCYGVRANDNSTNNFIYYLLKDRVSNFVQYSHGGVFNTITKDTFKEIDILLPPLTEQKAIASVLSSLDDKIDLLHRQNQTLEQMAETLFRQWFVEEADDSWEEGTLGDEFNFIMGQSPSGKSFNEEKIGIPMYQGNRDFGFRFPKNRVFTTEPKRFAEKFDTLISVRAPVGEQNMTNEKCCIGRGLSAFRYKTNTSFYTYTFFKMKSLMDEIKQFNETGTVFGSISKKDFNEMRIVIPPLNIVKRFQKEIKPIDDKIIINSKQIKTLEKLRDALLPKLMSGEVRVKM